MRAVQIKQFGGPEVLEMVDIEKPRPGKGQVLVKVYASSVNPFDIKFAGGMIPSAQLPITLGGDIAGVITELGEGVEHFAVGNNVYGSANALSGASGAFAEYAAVNAGSIARMPARRSLGEGEPNLDFKEAAASVLVGVSAVQALMEHIKLQSEQKILIHGGAGGIGTMAIQIAKIIGAHVVTTATGDGVDYVKKLGADEVIDYADSKAIEHPRQSRDRREDLSKSSRDFHAVFDTVGGETYKKSFEVLEKGGILVSMVMPPDKELSEKYGVEAISQNTKVTTEKLNILTDFIEHKGLKVHIDKVFSLDNIKEAFEEKQNADIKGKIVISVVK